MLVSFNLPGVPNARDLRMIPSGQCQYSSLKHDCSQQSSQLRLRETSNADWWGRAVSTSSTP